MEALFPGLTAALLAGGALSSEVGVGTAFAIDGRRLAPAETGGRGLLASRPALEAELRRRVRALPAVRVLDGAEVLAPEHDPAAARVTGVRSRLAGGPEQVLEAELVVDCLGRGSRSPAWLEAWGYARPREEEVRVGVAYTSAFFRRDPAAPAPLVALIGAASPASPRPALLLAQEPDAAGRPRWVAAVGGYAGDHPEVTLEAMARRARACGLRELEALALHGELLGPVTRFHFPSSVRRRYERLRRVPHGYLVLGDALASFNPCYGQGMTSAACQAEALGRVLAGGRGDLWRRFFRAAGKVVDVPWQLAVGADLALPGVPGPRSLAGRWASRWVARVQRAAVEGPVVAAAFLRVLHPLRPPGSLLAPGLAWRVRWPRRGARAAAALPGAELAG